MSFARKPNVGVFHFRVTVKPDNVTLEMNTTENNGCNDMWVNLTCYSYKANPSVHSCVLFKNEKEFILAKKDMDRENIKRRNVCLQISGTSASWQFHHHQQCYRDCE